MPEKDVIKTIADLNLDNKCCSRCLEPINPTDKILQYQGEFFHEDCFVCAQCFQPFPNGEFYDFEGDRYCLHCYQVLYAPECQKCGEFVNGEVVKALDHDWCKACFKCAECEDPLFEKAFVPFRYRAQMTELVKIVCQVCHDIFRKAQQGKDICQFCWLPIEKEESQNKLRFKGDPYHSYHFTCHSCDCELTGSAREHKGRLLCRKCYDKSEIAICSACRRPIEGRVVRALGKSWHAQHFVCCYCEKPFMHDTYFIGPGDGKPYCEYHYNKVFGDTCTYCSEVIQTQVIATLEKRWCEHCFRCYCCHKHMSPKEKFIEFDMKPVCKKCFEHFPYELKKRLKKANDQYQKDRSVQLKNERKLQSK